MNEQEQFIHRAWIQSSGGKAKGTCTCGWRGRRSEHAKAAKAAQKHADKYSGIVEARA